MKMNKTSNLDRFNNWLEHINDPNLISSMLRKNTTTTNSDNSLEIPQSVEEQFEMLNHQQNLTKYLNMTNFNFKDLNITADYINDFVVRLVEMRKHLNDNKTNVTQEESHSVFECECYCGGILRDVLLEYKTVHGYIALVICLFGTIANILNIIVLTRKEMCKAPINIILKWLAVTDMFVMMEYIPFSTYMYLIFPGRRDFKYSWAVYLLFHMHFTQILHTISISLTVTLAIWRYIAIKHPHGTFSSFILSHCSEAILISFILPPILCLPTYFVFRINEKSIQENNVSVLLYHLDAREETELYRFNFWIHSVIIKLLPCCILTVISFVLIRVLYKAGQRKVKLKGYNPASNIAILNGNKTPKCNRRTDRTTMLLVAVLLLFLITEFPQGILGLLSGILQKCFLIRCYTLFGELMDLLALINAAIGFVLYGLMSKQFRTSFVSVFCKTKSSTIEMTKVTGLTTTCV